MNNKNLPDKDKIYWTGETMRLINNGKTTTTIMEPTSKSLCIIDGKGFGVTKDGFTFCAGPVYLDGKPVRDATIDRHQTTPSKQEVVSKPSNGMKPSIINIHAQNNGGFETSKNIGGRPRKKDDEISRVTKWRRNKERLAVQGKLL